MDDVVGSMQDRSDAQLIAAVRDGDTSAYGSLFQRHVEAATRLARALTRSGEADDLVSDAFLKVLAVLQDGRGPDEAFRAYLLTAVRRLHLDRVRAVARTRPTDDQQVLDRGVPFEDAVSAAFENDAAARAFASLPERWQLVLWHLEVEGQKPAAVAPLLGMTPNSVSALAYRAREGLRAAYLESHAAEVTDETCRAVTPLLGGYVRQTLSARDTGKVERHLDGCRRCTGVHLELVEVNQNLRALLAPAVLGPAAAGYLGATGAAGLALSAGGVAASSALATASAGTAGGSLVAGTATAGGYAASGYAGATMLTSTIVSQVARVALVPAQAAAATVASAGTPAVVATTVVTGALTTGAVVTQTDLLDPAPPEVVATAPATPGTPEPPAPATDPPAEPTVEPTPEPPASTPDPTATPAPTDAPVAPDPTAPVTESPAPSPTPPPVTVTDFAVGAPLVTNEPALLHRRIVVPVAADGGANPVGRTVTATVTFIRNVRVQGLPTDGWTCDVAVGQRTERLSCAATLPAGQGGSFAFVVSGPRPAGTVTLSAPEDPDPANDQVAFESPGWVLP
jgi:RNA polymerase sigma factor (sigma-70 family)